MALNNSVTSID